MGDLLDETNRAIKAAGHLTDEDLGAIEALRQLAKRIDEDDALREAYISYQVDQGYEKIRPLQLDNVSLPTYLKFSIALGLTQEGRSKVADKKAPPKPAGTVASLRAAASKRTA